MGIEYVIILLYDVFIVFYGDLSLDVGLLVKMRVGEGGCVYKDIICILFGNWV